MASVEIVDLRDEFQQTQLTNPISKKLQNGIAEALSFQTQALVLINRREIFVVSTLPELRPPRCSA